jgi:DNA-binding LytR/AlgR family response regulator
MINCIVVDDEPLARQLILSYIAQVPGMTCLGSYQSAIEAFTALHQHQVDVIFIDIEMPGITGLNFIRSLRTYPKVIFITAYTEYAVDAFEIEATDYLVKPVVFERFLKAVQKIGLNRNESIPIDLQQPEISSIFLKVDKRLVKVDLSAIIYVEGLGDYLKVHIAGQTYVTYMSLGKLEALLPASKFIRIHRSTIINKRMIQFIEGSFVRVNNIDLSIGLTYRENLLKRLGNL